MSVEQRPSYTIKEQLASPLPHEHVVFSAEPHPPSPVTGLPDMQRFPDTYGYPAISGGTHDRENPFETPYIRWFKEQPPLNPERFQKIKQAIQKRCPLWSEGETIAAADDIYWGARQGINDEGLDLIERAVDERNGLATNQPRLPHWYEQEIERLYSDEQGT
jgi:hypothetical protein